MNIKEACTKFLEYVEPYKNLSKLCVLKINHTFRVMALCGKIAKSLNLSKEEINLAKMCGLLHDIGRFEQWKRYETFADKDSYDHADLGVEILKKDNFIRNFIDTNKYDEIILKSIKYHNKYKLPEELNSKELLFSKIVRDADKIDILYLYTVKEIDLDINSFTLDGNLDLENSKFSEKVYKSLLNKELVDRNDKKTKADRLSVSLGFIFDLNFEKSFEILKEKDYLNKEIEIYINKTKSEELVDQLKKIKSIINKYIEEVL